jgi:hypothetical protein
LVSRWQSGDHIFTVGDRQAPLVLGEQLSDGPFSGVFKLVEPKSQVAKLYKDLSRRPNLDRLGRHLNRALGKRTKPNPGSPLIARPAYGLRASPNADELIGFLMHNFDAASGWTALLYAGNIPALGHNPAWCLSVARGLAGDISYLHEQKLIVGDLSDTNVRVTRRAELGWIDVDSFGSEAAGGIRELSASGSTPGCRARELILGQDHGTFESDCFALALQIMRLLTCRFIHPFDVAPLIRSGTVTVEDRVEDGECWILEAEAYKTPFGHRGIQQWPEELSGLCEQSIRGRFRPPAATWRDVLAAIEPSALISDRPPVGKRAKTTSSKPTPTPDPVKTNRRPEPGPPADPFKPKSDPKPPPNGTLPTPKKRRLPILIAQVAVVFAVAGGIAFAIASAKHGRTNTPSTGGATSTNAATSTTSATASTSTTTTTPAAPSMTGPDEQLLAILPEPGNACTPVPVRQDGVKAMLSCQVSGLHSVSYRQFVSRPLLAAYTNSVTAGVKPQLSGNCPDSPPAEVPWFHTNKPNVTVGVLLCYIEGGWAYYGWSNQQTLVYATAGRTDGDLRELGKIWRTGNLG